MWLPIDTAPKDGRLIVLLCDWDRVAVVGYWGVDRHKPDSKETWRVKWDSDDFEGGYEATHWFPLPDIPKPELR